MEYLDFSVTYSESMHRNTIPVYVMGQTHPISYEKGKFYLQKTNKIYFSNNLIIIKENINGQICWNLSNRNNSFLYYFENCNELFDFLKYNQSDVLETILFNLEKLNGVFNG